MSYTVLHFQVSISIKQTFIPLFFFSSGVYYILYPLSITKAMEHAANIYSQGSLKQLMAMTGRRSKGHGTFKITSRSVNKLQLLDLAYK